MLRLYLELWAERTCLLQSSWSFVFYQLTGAFFRLGPICLLAFLSLLSKETGVMSLPLVVTYHLLTKTSLKEIFTATSNKGLRITVLKYMTVTLALVVMRVFLNWSSPVFSEQDNPASFAKSPLTRWLTYMYLWVFNWAQLICPASLSYDWQLGSIPLITNWQDRRNGVSLLGVLLTALASKQVLCSKDERRALVFSLLVMILPFIPASNLLFPVGFVAAERTLYIPSLGFCVLVSMGSSRLAVVLQNCAASQSCGKQWLNKKGILRAIIPTFYAFLLICLASKLVLRNVVWLDRGSLFRSGLASTPHNGKVFYNYGNFLRDQENKRDARLCYKEALRLWPDYVIALNNLATVTDNETYIERLLLRALHLDPHHATSLFNLADLYRQQGLCSKASFYFSKCRTLPDCLPDADLLQTQCSAQGYPSSAPSSIKEDVSLRNSYEGKSTPNPISEHVPLKKGNGMRDPRDSVELFESCNNKSANSGRCRGEEK